MKCGARWLTSSSPFAAAALKPVNGPAPAGPQKEALEAALKLASHRVNLASELGGVMAGDDFAMSRLKTEMPDIKPMAPPIVHGPDADVSAGANTIDLGYESATARGTRLEPIFDADLPPEIYAYRAGRNAQQAAVEVEELLFRGHPGVVDADLADYFGSIPHADLLKSVARRIVDRRVLHLVEMWLDCPVVETDERGRKTRTSEARDKRRGIPQGSPLSPLLANIYMRRFVLGWKKFGLERSLGTRAL
jgi:hypothetical protein